jgi:hypothetical protein
VHKPILSLPSIALFLVLPISNSKNPQVCITLILHTSHLLRSAGDLPVALSINNNLGASKQALAELLLCGAGVQAALPLGSPPPLLDQPVAEAGADEAVDGVGEEALAVEEGAHLDAELP